MAYNKSDLVSKIAQKSNLTKADRKSTRLNSSHRV